MASKLLLISILVAGIALPAWAARTRSPKKGLKQALFATLLFNLFYLAALRVLYPRL